MDHESYLCLQTLFQRGHCSPQEIGAVIAGIVALLVLSANLAIAIITLRTGSDNSSKSLDHQTELTRLRAVHESKMEERDQSHALALARERQDHESNLAQAEHSHQIRLEEARANSAIELEERRRFLDLRTKLLQETIDLQIRRLRDIRRACNQTLQDVVELKSLSPNLDRSEMLVRSGSILRKASIILAPADDKMPDLPELCYAPLRQVRDALVRVILSWTSEKADRQPDSPLHSEMLLAIDEMNKAVDVFVPAAQQEEQRVLTSVMSPSDAEESPLKTAQFVPSRDE